MTDDDLDRRLRDAMRVEPAPDLAARVRARVATEPVRPAPWRWRFVPVGALASIALAALVFSPPDAPPPRPTSPAFLPASVPIGGKSEPLASVPPAAVERAPRRRHAARAGDGPVTTLAPGDAEAFRVLLAFSRAATAPADALESMAFVEPLALQPIEVAPLEIYPLVLGEDSTEGGPQ